MKNFFKPDDGRPTGMLKLVDLSFLMAKLLTSSGYFVDNYINFISN